MDRGAAILGRSLRKNSSAHTLFLTQLTQVISVYIHCLGNGVLLSIKNQDRDYKHCLQHFFIYDIISDINKYILSQQIY